MNVTFSLSSLELSSRLQILSKVISGKNGMSILDCFLVEIASNTLKITASDGDNTLIATVGLTDSSSDFKFAINAKNLLDAIKSLPEQPISFEVDSENFKTIIHYQNGYISLIGQDADEYPKNSIAEGEQSVQFKVNSELLLESLNRALSSVSTDTTHMIMTGVLFDITDTDISIVASDGRKLVYTRFPNTDGIAAGNYVLPSKPALLLKSILGKDNDEVTIQFSERRAIIGMNGYALSSLLLEGLFPPYNKVVPENNPYHLTLNREAFTSLLNRVLCVVSDTKLALVRIHIESDKIVTRVQNLDYSLSAEESMNCDYDGMPMNIGFKGNVLQEFMRKTDSETIELQIADQSRAVVIVPSPQPNTVKDENGEILHPEQITMLLMPSATND